MRGVERVISPALSAAKTPSSRGTQKQGLDGKQDDERAQVAKRSIGLLSAAHDKDDAVHRSGRANDRSSTACRRPAEGASTVSVVRSEGARAEVSLERRSGFDPRARPSRRRSRRP